MSDQAVKQHLYIFKASLRNDLQVKIYKVEIFIGYFAQYFFLYSLETCSQLDNKIFSLMSYKLCFSQKSTQKVISNYK